MERGVDGWRGGDRRRPRPGPHRHRDLAPAPPGVDAATGPGPLHGVHGHARVRRADRVPHRRAVDRARRHAHRLRGHRRARRRSSRTTSWSTARAWTGARSTSGRASCSTSRRSTCRCAPRDAGTVRFDELGDAMKSVELWLPQSAASELRALRVPDGARVEAPQHAQRRWVHYGSSISHCVEAHGPTDVWPAVAARARRRRAAAARVRRPVPARPVRRPHDRAAGRRPDQPEGRHQRREREQPHRADVPERAARLPRHGARAPPGRAAARGVADHLPDGRDPPRSDRCPTAPAGSAWSRAARPSCGRPTSRCSGSARSSPRSWPAAASGATTGCTTSTGWSCSAPTDVGDLPDGLHPNGDGYLRMGERFAAHAFAPGGPFAA